MTVSPEQLATARAVTRPEDEALKRLFERHRAQIASFCMRELGSREDADDATQLTFINAFRGLSRGADPEYESAWLFQIARNVCLNSRRSSFRRRKVETPSDLETVDATHLQMAEASDDLFALKAALSTLPDLQRQVILRREWQGMTYREIAADLEVSEAAVETAIFRARRAMALALGDAPARAKRRRLQGVPFLTGFKGFALGAGGKVAVGVATVAATAVVAANPSLPGRLLYRLPLVAGTSSPARIHAPAQSHVSVVAPLLPDVPVHLPGGEVVARPRPSDTRPAVATVVPMPHVMKSVADPRPMTTGPAVEPSPPAASASATTAPFTPAADSPAISAPRSSAGAVTPGTSVTSTPAAVPADHPVDQGGGSPTAVVTQTTVASTDSSPAAGDTTTGGGQAKTDSLAKGATPPGQTKKQDSGNTQVNGQPIGQGNGTANGQANGQANGNGNGQANGKANGLGNGNANGQANGKAIGQGNGNAYGNTNAQAGVSSAAQGSNDASSQQDLQSNNQSDSNANGKSTGQGNGNTGSQSNAGATSQSDGNAYGQNNGNAYGQSNGNAYGQSNGDSNANGTTQVTATTSTGQTVVYAVGTTTTTTTTTTVTTTTTAGPGNGNGNAYGQANGNGRSNGNGQSADASVTVTTG
jgi:RNA polymerase sigma factor (sigma-70 family)